MLHSTFWEKYFEVYDNLNTLIPYQDLLNTIVDELNIKKGEKILDAGSGTGNLAIRLEMYGAVVTGFDSSLEGIAIHRKKQPHVSIISGNLAKQLPFPNNYFDKICSNNTIYTIPKEKRLAIFNEFYRIIKSNGVIVVSNIAVNFTPLNIYLDHIKRSLQRNGLMRTICDIFKLCIPTIRIFYYNYLIKKEHILGLHGFVDENDQRELLKVSGFRNISNNKRVYSNQAILNKAVK